MGDLPVEISVVLISFNGEEFIEDCLSSVYESLKPYSSEVIIVDNNSADGTIDLVKKDYSDSILIQNNENRGFAPAVNQGLKRAEGKYVLILNQDTKIVDDAIGKLKRRMEGDNKVGSIGPKFIGFDGNLQKASRAFPRYRDIIYELTGLSRLFSGSKIFSRWKMGWFDHESEAEVDQPMGAALMITKRIVKEVGLFDERFPIFLNDVDYCRRIQEAGYRNLYYPDAVVMHYVGGSTRKNKPAMIIESHRSMYDYFKKYSKGIIFRAGLIPMKLLLFLSGRIRAALARHRQLSD